MKLIGKSFIFGVTRRGEPRESNFRRGECNGATREIIGIRGKEEREQELEAKKENRRKKEQQENNKSRREREQQEQEGKRTTRAGGKENKSRREREQQKQERRTAEKWIKELEGKQFITSLEKTTIRTGNK